MIKLVILVSFFFQCFSVKLDFDDQLSDAKNIYSALEHKAKTYGDCWANALSDLHIGCKQLDEEKQSRLALAFANCFLKYSTGAQPCICPPDDPISNCINRCSDRVFQTFRSFFTHTQNVCPFLRHQEWQADMAGTAVLLTENSKNISRILDESSQSQYKMLEAFPAQQKQSLSEGRVLSAKLIRFRKTARDLYLYKEFQTTT